MFIQAGFIKIGYYLNRENQFCLVSMTWSWKIGSNITRVGYFGIGEKEFEKRLTAAGSVSESACIENIYHVVLLELLVSYDMARSSMQNFTWNHDNKVVRSQQNVKFCLWWNIDFNYPKRNIFYYDH